MADINLSAGDDVYVHPEPRKDEWNNYFGRDGDDVLKLYQGTAIGGRGNDRFERLFDATNPNRELGAAYWDSPAGIVANLAAGWIDDGFGTRDTVVGVSKVHGSGQNDRFIGDAADNFFHPNGGRDTLDGGAGVDGFDVREIPPNADGSGSWRPAVPSDLDIRVAADGLSATVSVAHYPQITYSSTNMEYLSLMNDSNRYWFADLITPQTMAEQTIAAGGSLRWNAASPLGTAVVVSYSFVTNAPASGPGASGFRAFTPAEQQAVREILAHTAELANIGFSEVAEGAPGVHGQLRFGVSQQVATKGVAWLPGQDGESAGDVWMDVETMASMAASGTGSEGWAALLHEIGHALGLRHPRNSDPGDAWPMQLVESAAKPALSVMADQASPDGLFRSDWGPLDVLALRHLYGTRSVASGDTAYTLATADSSHQRTITDDGGSDTIDASALTTGVRLNLAAGALSDVGLSGDGFAGVENLAISGGSLIEHAIGTAADDVLLGNTLDNRLSGGLGNDWLDGGAGTDTAVFAGARGAYEISNAFGSVYVRARDGSSGYDTLVGIERLQFADATVTLASSGPLSNDSQVTLDEDQSTGGLLALPEGASNRAGLSYALTEPPAHGSAAVAADGSFNYTPAANFWGDDGFGYRITTSAGSNEYRVFASVLPVNDGPPQSVDASLIVPLTQVFGGNVPAATDIDGDALSYALLTEPGLGSLQFTAGGSFSYTPPPETFGSTSFSYSVSDGMGGSTSWSVTLRLGLVTEEDTAINRLLPDPAGAPRSSASYAAALQPAHGTLAVSSSGDLLYTPVANYHGEDNFSYDLTVGNGTTRHVVAVRIDSVDDGAPVGASANVVLAEDGSLTSQLPAAVDPDGAAVRYELASAASHGQATLSAGGEFSYRPDANYFGSESLGFRVIDAQGAYNTYTVALRVDPVNDLPLAANAGATTAEDSVFTGTLPAATDVDGDAVTYSLVDAAAHGTVAIETNGNWRFTPAANRFGSDSFSYRIDDGQGGRNTYTVNLLVTPVNDAPTGSVSIAGTARIWQTLTLAQTLADVEGPGPLTIAWLRNGLPVPGASGASLALTPADVGAAISVRVSWTDGQGTAESVTSAPTAAVAGYTTIDGSAGNDSLTGSAGPDAISGLAGNDTLSGGDDADSIVGGEGNDVILGGSGADTLEGGAGVDTLGFAGGGAVIVDLKTGSAMQGGASDLISGFEAVITSPGDDLITGADRPGNPLQQDEFFALGGGNDSVSGGSGIDRVEYSGPRSAYTIQRSATVPGQITVIDNAGGGTDTLTSIERILFADTYLAFGQRAEEIARVAFALWTPEIAGSQSLFAIGYSYYDVGYSYETMIEVALSYFTGMSDLDLAFRLKESVPGSSFFLSDLQAAMSRAGGGMAGRIAAVKLAADDPASLESVRLAGLIDNGVVADVSMGLFTMVTGGG
jgi:hypothetical protein